MILKRGKSHGSPRNQRVDPPNNIAFPRDEELRVYHLIDANAMTWKLDLLRLFVAEEDIPHIVSLRVSSIGRPDSFSWDFTKSGLYTVKSGYSVAHDMRLKAGSHIAA